MTTRYDVITGRKSKDGSKTFWSNIGSAWPSDKGGMSIELSALPIPDHEGRVRMLIVEPKPREDAPPSRGRASTGAPVRHDDMDDSIPF
jgi:hypothetical protein